MEEKETEMEDVIVLQNFNDMTTRTLIKASPKPIKMSKERVDKNVMLGLVKRVEKQNKANKPKK